MKLAVIDLGTNTFHLLLAQLDGTGFEILQDLKRPVMIGQGGISAGTISTKAQERGLATLRTFRDILDQEQAEQVVAVATSAFRNAENGRDFIQRIYTEIGIPVEIISGEKEAQLIHQGVSLALSRPIDKALIMDIGGGSVEFILTQGDKIRWMESFEIGAQRLMDKFHQNDPITADEINGIESYLEETLALLWAQARDAGAVTLVGSSGTFDTLIEISYRAKGKRVDNEASCFELSLQDFRALYEQIISKNRSQRSAIPGMIEMRVDMIVVACCLINTVIKHIAPSPIIQVSGYALKEGVLADQLKALSQ